MKPGKAVPVRLRGTKAPANLRPLLITHASAILCFQYV